MLGVVDYCKQYKTISSYSTGNAMCYSAYDNRKYPSGSSEGNGFKTGDMVEIDVDRNTKTIKYIVNGKL